MKPNQYYVACEGQSAENDAYRHYFRLYRVGEDGVHRLVEQGLADKVQTWTERYKAELNMENPYPHLD